MDDALSAVDSHVGKRLLDNCLLRGPLADKTRVLVTHALHVLDKTDYIYVMNEGVIVEQGTYAVRGVLVYSKALFLTAWISGANEARRHVCPPYGGVW